VSWRQPDLTCHSGGGSGWGVHLRGAYMPCHRRMNTYPGWALLSQASDASYSYRRFGEVRRVVTSRNSRWDSRPRQPVSARSPSLRVGRLQ